MNSYHIFVYDSSTGSYHATEETSSFAAACAIAYREQLKYGLAYVERPNGTIWYPCTDEEEE